MTEAQELKRAIGALKKMFAACNEWAAEFTQHKRAMDWGVVNDAYVSAQRCITDWEKKQTRTNTCRRH